MANTGAFVGLYGAVTQRLGVIHNSATSATDPDRYGKAALPESFFNLCCFRFWPFLAKLYFSVFGLTERDVITNDFEFSEPEKILAEITFAAWMIVISIFFLSMLIAFVTNSYQRVQVRQPYTKLKLLS